MKRKNIAGIVVLAAFAWGCEQKGSEEQKSNAYEQNPPQEQGQTLDPANQNSSPLQQQPPQATEVSEVSDKELKQFAGAVKQVQVVNQEAQQKMIGVVEEQGLDARRFNEIQQAQQNPQQKTDATDEEMKKYQAVTKELGKMQVKIQKKMEDAITEEGLTTSRYQEIGQTIQTDPELQKKIQEYIQG